MAVSWEENGYPLPWTWLKSWRLSIGINSSLPEGFLCDTRKQEREDADIGSSWMWLVSLQVQTAKASFQLPNLAQLIPRLDLRVVQG